MVGTGSCWPLSGPVVWTPAQLRFRRHWGNRLSDPTLPNLLMCCLKAKNYFWRVEGKKEVGTGYDGVEDWEKNRRVAKQSLAR